MMKAEFIARTKYEPSDEEYHYIEEAWYEANTTSKDIFCKQWLKDRKSGKWDMELRFRKLLNQQRANFQELLREKEEDLAFYREQFKIGYEAQMKLAKIESIIK